MNFLKITKSIHINLLHKILKLVLYCKELNYLLKQNEFDSKILQY